jgi:hypothetical protein
MMGETETTRKTSVGAILAIAGGGLLAIGSFLAWAEVSGGGTSVAAKGIDGSDGYITLGAGVVALLVGILLLRQAKRALAVLAIVAGLIGGGVAIYDALTAKDSVLDSAAEELAPTLGASPDQVRVLLDEAIDAGQLSISLAIGIYVVIAGGALALVGGILSVRAPDEDRGRVAIAPPQPPVAGEPSTPAAPLAPASEATTPVAPPAPEAPATDEPKT